MAIELASLHLEHARWTVGGWMVLPVLLAAGCSHEFIDLTPEDDTGCEVDAGCDDGADEADGY